MDPFIEKLQKGMGIQPANGVDIAQTGQIPAQEEQEAPPEDGAVFAAYKAKAAKAKEKPRKLITAENVDEMADPPKPIEEENPLPPKTIKKNPKKVMANKKSNKTIDTGWLNQNDGQLAINVYQTDVDLVLQAAIAGVRPEDIDILIEDEVVSVKGNRQNPMPEAGDYFMEECYFGPFSRKVILPVEVDSGRADAAMKDGFLTIRIPKIVREKKKKVTIKG
jgi:HSP20 family protein